MTTQDHQSPTTLFLYAQPDSPLSDRQWDQVHQHLFACPTCMRQADYFMRMDDPFPEELDEHGELLPPEGWTPGDAVAPLRAAASTPGMAVDRSERSPAVFCRIGDIEIRRLPGEPICLHVIAAELAGRGLHIVHADGRRIAARIDAYRRLDIAAEDLALLQRWVHEGVDLGIELD